MFLISLILGYLKEKPSGILPQISYGVISEVVFKVIFWYVIVILKKD